ncbi:ABC transporter permease [Natronolimnohabitans innermongolicus]|uniref:Binding-protein-dependent transporters inner membrane component n=1 Tax=Natronolimnohabitans innermongolicus JCM 12255 TaxID=1227499 RepID=L9WRK7_9EURY|nr:ABC transporter permease [Natronolimnohabitans innermongolicus]ELY50948.1 binding-protein-dependent transporters inner membrane component [Natronolimnohabitans innermongolicus JCM 12255]
MDVGSATFDRSSLVSFAKGTVSLAVVLVLWEVVTQLGMIHYYFLPPLSDILFATDSSFVALTADGTLIYHGYLTVRRALVGLVIATVLGIAVGVLSARSKIMSWFWDPIIEVGYPVPVIALVPVFIFWFGTGDVSKIALVTLGCFWPVAINARNATREVDENLIWSARMMGTSDRELLRRVVVPAAAPGIISGLQIALPISLIITFVFEMVAGGGGLGHIEIQGVRSFDSVQVYASLIAIMILGFALDRALRILRHRLLAWT